MITETCIQTHPIVETLGSELSFFEITVLNMIFGSDVVYQIVIFNIISPKMLPLIHKSLRCCLLSYV